MLAAKCAECDGREPYEPSEWFNHISFLYGLQRAGYPFGANELAIEEWLDIGHYRDHIEAMQWQMK